MAMTLPPSIPEPWTCHRGVGKDAAGEATVELHTNGDFRARAIEVRVLDCHHLPGLNTANANRRAGRDVVGPRGNRP